MESPKTENGNAPEEVHKREGRQVHYLLSCRVMLALVGFIGTLNLYALRMNMSVGILCMTNHTAVREMDALKHRKDNLSLTPAPTNLSSQADGFDCQLNVKTMKELDGEFAWDSETRGIILGVFFWGYLVTQMPAGLAVQRIGSKIVILVFMAVTAISTILVPVAARTSRSFIMVLRVISGMGSGVWFPCFHHLWSRWAPPLERSKLVGFTYAGVHVGNALTLPIAGLLCQYGFAGGWPSIFYLFGAFGLAWCVLWAFMVYDGPTKHPRITVEERDFIVQSLHGQVDDSDTSMKVPLKSVLTSMPVWAIVVVNVTFDWNGYLFLTSVPTYMKTILKFDMSENGLVSALPYLGFWLGQVVAAFLSDFLREREILSTTWTRKLMNSLGMFGPAIIVIILGFFTCKEKYAAVALLTLALTMKGAVFVGCFVNHVDIAPRYAGFLFAASNSIAAVTGFFAPYMVGAMTKHNLQSEWQFVFYVCAGVYVFGGLFFLIFASGDLQPWARGDHEIEVEMDKLTNGDAPTTDPLLAKGDDAGADVKV